MDPCRYTKEVSARATIQRKVAPYLEPGEVVEHAFRGRAMLGPTKLAKATYVVVGTNQAVLLFKTSIWSTTTPKELVTRLPRESPITFEKRRYWSPLRIGDHEIRVSPGTFKEAEALARQS